MNTAMAILRSGRSFQEASESTGIDINKIIQKWKEIKKQETS